MSLEHVKCASLEFDLLGATYSSHPMIVRRTATRRASVPRPTNVARYKVTQQERERQQPMSLRSPQQLVACFGRPHLFTPRSADPGNIIGQYDRVYKHATR